MFAKAMSIPARPGSESGAEMDKDVLGTCEGLRLPVRETRIRVNREKNTCDAERVSPCRNYRTQRDRRGTVLQAESEKHGTGIKTGRLSPYIVAFENRVTSLGRSR